MKLVRIRSDVSLWKMAKVNEKAKLLFSCFQVVDELRLIIGKERLNCFQFNNNFLKTKKIGLVSFGKWLTFEEYR
jgi:hypothetical protein